MCHLPDHAEPAAGIPFYREDPGGYQRLSVQHPSMKEPEIVATGRSDLYPAIMRAFSQSLRILVNLKEKHPQTYQILNAKLEEPI